MNILATIAAIEVAEVEAEAHLHNRLYDLRNSPVNPDWPEMHDDEIAYLEDAIRVEEQYPGCIAQMSDFGFFHKTTFQR